MSTPPAHGYERSYAVAQALAAKWSPPNLMVALQTLMSNADKVEETWGAIDALTDLINKAV